MRILAGIYAEGYAAEHPSEPEETAAPHVGHSSGSFDGDRLGLGSAVGTGQLVRVVVLDYHDTRRRGLLLRQAIATYMTGGGDGGGGPYGSLRGLF